MKIGLVCPYNITKNGGVQDVIKHLQIELNRRGHDAYILAPLIRKVSGPKPLKTIFLGVGRPVKALNTTGEVSVSVDPYELERILDKQHFDLLHFHEPWVPILARQILRRSKSVNVATFHAKLPDSLMGRAIERVVTPYTKSILQNLDVLTAVSNVAAEYVRSLTDRQVAIIPNAVDLKKYQRPNLESNHSKPTKMILYVGRLEKRKGVKYLIRAFAELQKTLPRAVLKIAGDGPERHRLERLAAELKVTNVRFLGFVSEASKRQLLRSTDLFCAPAIEGESFGIVLLEAMASGCVTVAGNNPGYESVLNGDGQISLVNPKDKTEFARRLQMMLLNNQLRKNWLGWATKEIKRYDYAKIASQYETLYKNALKNRR